MRRNLSHIIAAAFNEPLLLEPAYARVFFCALGREMGAASLSVPQQQVQLDAPGMLAETDEYMAGGKRPARVYRVVNGIAVLPVTGTLVHRLGGMRPFSGMTGYDGIVACLQQAMADSQVRGILLDIDSPGGQAAGAFDCADMIYRLRQQKPVWALCNDTACSAAMLLASACSRRLVTQTSRIGSIGVMMSHVSYAGHLAQAGVDITLIYSGAHKVDGNQFEALPAEVRQDMQQRIDAARRMFAEKVAMFTGLSVDAVTGTEAAVFEGQSGIEAGLADELVNASDAISVMATALNSNVRGGTMPQLTATEAAAQENQRVMGILTCQEAKGREQLATMLAGQQGMSVEQARAILAAAAPQQPVASTQSEADRIMACEEANGREQLAATLAAMPEMTVEKARPILAASPQADAGPSLRDQIMALDEAKGAEARLTDELVNASDAISVMATALNSNVRGGTMPQLTATEAAAQENQRVMGILTCQEAKGREQLATMLAGQQGMSVEQARAILAAAAPQQPVASTQSEADRIMACEEANGREQLAATLAAMPEMTVEKARPILAASPQADAGPSLRDQIMALDEAKGAEAQAEQLAACPGMTVESARAVLAAGSGKAEPVSASTTALFERIMANHSPAAVQGGVPQTSADGDADVKMLMAMP
ncbi:S49 family peptidase [Escherichia coli]